MVCAAAGWVCWTAVPGWGRQLLSHGVLTLCCAVLCCPCRVALQIQAEAVQKRDMVVLGHIAGGC